MQAWKGRQAMQPAGQMHGGPHLGIAQDGARDGDALALTAAELAALLSHLCVIPGTSAQ